MIRRRGLVIGALIFAVAAGCGHGSKEKGKEAKKEFRIPDSLLAPMAGYHLTADSYDAVKGGVMANAQIELHYPPSPIARYLAVRSFGIAKKACETMAAEIGKPTSGKLVIIGAADLDEYRFLTRKEWWYYGYIRGDTIYFEPFDIMLKRTIADIGITQKIAQLALHHRSGGRIPLWLRESIASRIAGEKSILEMQAEEFRSQGWNTYPSPEEVEIALAEASDRGSTRIAFLAAQRMLERLLSISTMQSALAFLDRLAEGKTIDEASEEAFGMGYDALINRVRIDK
jgi:hypothetical protein